jgi:hypothetical protein
MVGSSTATIQHCTGCGARVVFEDAVLSGVCSYCDSPMVDEARALPSFDGVVPFRVPQRGAMEQLRTYLDNRRWAPATLRAVRLHERGLRGMLVPFWVYEGVVRSEYRAKIGLHWHRTEKYKDQKGERRTRQVRETEWFRLRGSAARQVEDHVVSASVGLPEHEAVSLAPFDLGWVTSYDPRLLSGFEAELPTIEDSEAERTAVDELRAAEAARILRELLPGDVNHVDAIESRIEVASRRLVLLPVWVATHRHGDVVLRLLVNGQTGKVIGRVPVSKAKVAALVLALLFLAGLIAALVWWSSGTSWTWISWMGGRR